MVMCYSPGWGEAADRAFIERHGHDGEARIIEMVARISRPSSKQGSQPLSQGEIESAKCLLASCD